MIRNDDGSTPQPIPSMANSDQEPQSEEDSPPLSYPDLVRSSAHVEQSSFGRSDEVRRTHLKFVQLLDGAESIHIPDIDDDGTCVEDLVARVAEVVDATMAGIESVFQAYETAPLSETPKGPLVGDVAYFALMTLGEIRGHLNESVPSTGNPAPFQVYERCAKACRAIRKSIVAVDAAVCAHEGLTRRITDSAAVRKSLEVRRAYTKLRRAIFRSKPGHAEVADYVRFFRSVGTQIAILVGSKTFTTLRLYDRFQIKVVQGRVIEWLRSDPSVEDGKHIVQDVLGFSTMLQQVSHRSELCQHDERLLHRLRAELDKDFVDGLVPESLLDEVTPLEGLDDKLTQMLDERERDAERWRQCFDTLVVTRFGGGAGALW